MALAFNESALVGKTAVSLTGLMEYLGCSRTTMWRMQKNGQLPAFFEVSGTRYFDTEVIRDFYKRLNLKQNRYLKR